MFSENSKISKSQLNKMIILDLFGITSLLFPTTLANTGGRDGIFSIILGTLLTLLFIIILFWIIKRMKESYLEDIGNRYGSFVSGLVGILFLVQMFLASIMVLLLLGEVVSEALLTGTSRSLVMILLLLVCVYASFHGIEERARMVEVLFYIVFIPLLFMFLFSLREVKIDYLFPLLTEPSNKILDGTYFVFAVFSNLNLLLILAPFIEQKSKQEFLSTRRTAIWAVIIMGAINLFIYMVILGAFGVRGTGVQSWPLITLMNIIKVPGGFIERLDAIMLGVWILSIFSLISAFLSYEGIIIKKIIRPGKFYFWVILSAFLTYVGGLVFGNFEKAYEVYKNYLLYLGAPVAVGIPLIFIAADYIYSSVERKNKDESV